MPNWCYNKLSVTHCNPAIIDRLAKAQDAPLEDLCISDDRMTLTARFTSAYAPPIPFYQELQKQGCGVQAAYFEPNMAFMGYFDRCGDHRIEDVEDFCLYQKVFFPHHIKEALQGIEWTGPVKEKRK